MKHQFKIGDKVFDIRYGWMEINKICDDEIETELILTTTQKHGKFDFIHTYFENDIKFLSFTEYTLDGITQERPKEEFKICDLGYFWDYDLSDKAVYGKLTAIDENEEYPYTIGNCIRYKYFSLTPPDLNY